MGEKSCVPLILLSGGYCVENRECHDENVFLKADRALSKLNFLFHLN